jgi:hypothetical protein
LKNNLYKKEKREMKMRIISTVMAMVTAVTAITSAASAAALAEKPTPEVYEEYVDGNNMIGNYLYWGFDSDTGTLHIKGNGDMYDWKSDNDVPWNEFRESVTAINLPDGLTRIGNCAFNRTSITEILIPESVKTVGTAAFNTCEKLRDVTVLGGGVNFNNGSFSFSKNIERIIFNSVVPPVNNSGSFTGISDNATVFIPAGSRRAYVNLGVVNRFDIVELDEETVFVPDEKRVATTTVDYPVDPGKHYCDGENPLGTVEFIYDDNGAAIGRKCITCGFSTLWEVYVPGVESATTAISETRVPIATTAVITREYPEISTTSDLWVVNTIAEITRPVFETTIVSQANVPVVTPASISTIPDSVTWIDRGTIDSPWYFCNACGQYHQYAKQDCSIVYETTSIPEWYTTATLPTIKAPGEWYHCYSCGVISLDGICECRQTVVTCGYCGMEGTDAKLNGHECLSVNTKPVYETTSPRTTEVWTFDTPTTATTPAKTTAPEGPVTIIIVIVAPSLEFAEITNVLDILKILAGMMELTPELLEELDYNCDGEVTIVDALECLKKLAGISELYKSLKA